MASQSPIDLLKQYIKTLIGSEVVLSGVIPRRWGHEFSRSELASVHRGLKRLLKLADAETDKALIEEFRRIGKSEQYLHWFLFKHWQTIVELLAE